MQTLSSALPSTLGLSLVPLLASWRPLQSLVRTLPLQESGSKVGSKSPGAPHEFRTGPELASSPLTGQHQWCPPAAWARPD